MTHTIQVEISEKAYKKLRTQSMTKQMMGADHMTLADLFLAKVLEGVEDSSNKVSIKAREDV